MGTEKKCTDPAVRSKLNELLEFFQLPNPGEQAVIESHLNECEACQEAFLNLMNTASKIRPDLFPCPEDEKEEEGKKDTE